MNNIGEQILKITDVNILNDLRNTIDDRIKSLKELKEPPQLEWIQRLFKQYVPETTGVSFDISKVKTICDNDHKTESSYKDVEKDIYISVKEYDTWRLGDYDRVYQEYVHTHDVNHYSEK